MAADSSAWIVRNITSGDQSSFEFEGDNPYQEYIITLTTFNDVGASLERELQATSYTGEDGRWHVSLNRSVVEWIERLLLMR